MIDESILSFERKGRRKGENGKVLVVAGSEDYAGAAVLASTACEAILRSGADLCVACCPEKIAWLVNNKVPDAITKKFPGKHFSEEQADEVIRMAQDYDILLIGPGLGRKAIPFAKKVVESVDIPKVIDADATRAVDLKKVNNAILTPHSKEFKELLENSGLKASSLQENLGSNVVLKKGKVDEIISKNEKEENETGNSVMTKGGTGDVLAGLCAGFASQGNDLFRSACMAAYLNGKVGDILQEEKGRTFTASNIVENLHRAYH